MLGKRKNDSTVNCVIGIDTVLEGNLKTKETTRIEGCIKGNIISDGIFIIGKAGRVEGNIAANNVLIAGQVKGNINASGKVEVADTGSVDGDITAASLVIDENAKFQGKCNMKLESSKTELAPNKEEVLIGGQKNAPIEPDKTKMK